MEQQNTAAKKINSRIGKAVIEVPTGVTITSVGTVLEVKGPKGVLKRDTLGRVSFEQTGAQLHVKPVLGEHASAYWGLYRTLLMNMVVGVSKGYSKVLEIQGTGYRAAVAGKSLNLTLGFSHPVQVEPPAGITFEVDKAGLLTVSGIDKELVGQIAAKIIALRPAEPYQGKGVRYQGQVIRRKAGKSAAKK